MKRILSGILAFSVLLTSIIIFTAADGAAVISETAESPLLCSDPGFESGRLDKSIPNVDGLLSQWSETQFSGAGTFITDEKAYSGTHSLRVKTSTWNVDYFALGFEIEPDTDYKLSFKYQNESFTKSSLWLGIMPISAYTGSSITHGDLLTDRVALNDTRTIGKNADGWRSAYISFNSGSADKYAAEKKVVQMVIGQSGDHALKANECIYFDEVYLEKITDTDEALEPLGNGSGFETDYLETFVPVMGTGIPQWDADNKTSNNAGAYRTTENPHSGTYALKYVARSWNKNGGLAAFNVTADTDYILKFWYRADSADKHASASVRIANIKLSGWKASSETGTVMPNTMLPQAASDEWKKAEMRLHTDKTGMIQVFFEGLDGETPIYIDDISMKKYNPDDYEQDTNVFPYGTFEAGLTGWTVQENSWCARASNTVAHGGKSSMNISGGWSWCTVKSNSFNVKKNTDYVLAFYYKGNPSWTKAIIEGTEKIIEKVVGDASEADDWTLVTERFNSGDNEQLNLTYMRSDSNSVNLYVDDIYIAEITDNLVMNGDFTSGELFWSIDSESHGAETAEMGADGKETKVMRLVNGSNAIVSQAVTLEKNKNYELSFDYKGTLTSGLSHWSVSDRTATFSKTNLKAFGSLENSEEWKKAVAVFTAAADGRYYINFQSVNGCDYMIDNVTLTVTDKPADSFELGKDAEFVSQFWRKNAYNTAYKYVPKDGKNIIADGGFENGGGQWDNAEFLNGAAALSSDSAAAHTGGRGIVFKADGKKTASFFIDITPNSGEYLFGVWVKGAAFDTGNGVSAALGITVPDTGDFIKERTLPSYDGEWHLVEYTFKPNALSKLAFTITATDTTVYLDDIFLCKTADMEEHKPALSTIENTDIVNENPSLLGCDDSDNLFDNFDFDNTKSNVYWDGVNGSSYGKYIKIEDSESSIYGNSFHYKPAADFYGNAAKTGSYYIKYINVEKNTDYTFSGKYSLVEPSKNGTFTESYFGFIDTNPRIISEIKTFPMDVNAFREDCNWQTAAVTFNTGGYDRIAFVVYDGGGEAYFDDLRLFKTADAKPLAERPDNFPAKKLESASYTVKDGIVKLDSPIALGSLISKFRYSQYIKAYDKDGKLITDRNAPAGTAEEIRLTDGPVIKDRAVIALKGDIDCNGKVDSADAEMLLNYLSGISVDLSKAQLAAADFDGNGVIELYDVMKNSAGYGAVKNAAASVKGPSSLTVGEEFELELTVPAGLYGVSAEIKFDTDKLIYQDAVLNAGGGWKISVNRQNGVLRLNAADPELKRATNKNPIITITFIVASGVKADDVITVDLTNLKFTDGKSVFKANDIKWSFGGEASSGGDNNGSYGGDTVQTIITEVNGPSNNNMLKSLEIEGVVYSPEFTPENKTYTAEVPFEISSVNVIAVPQNEKATVTVESTDLKYVGKNIVRVVVLSESGLKRTYRVTITRKDRVKDSAAHGIGYVWWIIIAAGAVIIAAAAVITVITVKKRKKKNLTE